MIRFHGRNLAIAFVVGGLLAGGSVEVLADGLKKVVAVSRFENKANYKGQWAIGDGLADMLADSLVQSGKFMVVERQNVGDVLGEQDLGNSGRMAKSKSAQTGKMVSSQILVQGAITEYQANSSGGGQGFRVGGFKLGKKKSETHLGLIIRGIDTTSGEVLFSERVEGKAASGGLAFSINTGGAGYGKDSQTSDPIEKAAQVAIDNAVAIITSKLQDVPYQGSVIRVKGSDVYISAGKRSGASVGDQFSVFGVGEEFIDPITGENLGSEEEMIGMVKVVSVNEKYSKANAVGELSGVKIGDRVRSK